MAGFCVLNLGIESGAFVSLYLSIYLSFFEREAWLIVVGLGLVR